MSKRSILVVCSANICRSPMAQGLLQQHVEREGLGRSIVVDSAGTHVARGGQRPDARAQRACAAIGVDLKRMRSRQIVPADWEKHDFILAMDAGNHRSLAASCPAEQAHKLAMFLAFATETAEREVPDPYFGNYAGFERVRDLLGVGVVGLMKHLRGEAIFPFAPPKAW